MSRKELLERRRRENEESLANRFGSRSPSSPPSGLASAATPSPGGPGRSPVSASPETAETGLPAASPIYAGTHKDGVPDLYIQEFKTSGQPLDRLPALGIGVAGEQGRRPDMEDAHAMHAQLQGAPSGTSFFLVADGHAGRQVADLLAAQLPGCVADTLQASGKNPDIPKVLLNSFIDTDRDIFKKVGSADGGAVAVAALLRGPELWVAHVGDCRAVLCDGGKAIGMTHDHRATDPVEKKRVEAGGAFVAFGRVCASLMITRTFGDFGFKGVDTLMTQPAKPVSNIPDIAKANISSSTEFMLLACDGVFDVMDNDEAISICRQNLHLGPQKCAQELVNSALRKGTADNVTAAIVTFQR